MCHRTSRIICLSCKPWLLRFFSVVIVLLSFLLDSCPGERGDELPVVQHTSQRRIGAKTQREVALHRHLWPEASGNASSALQFDPITATVAVAVAKAAAKGLKAVAKAYKLPCQSFCLTCADGSSIFVYRSKDWGGLAREMAMTVGGAVLKAQGFSPPPIPKELEKAMNSAGYDPEAEMNMLASLENTESTGIEDITGRVKDMDIENAGLADVANLEEKGAAIVGKLNKQMEDTISKARNWKQLPANCPKIKTYKQAGKDRLELDYEPEEIEKSVPLQMFTKDIDSMWKVFEKVKAQLGDGDAWNKFTPAPRPQHKLTEDLMRLLSTSSEWCGRTSKAPSGVKDVNETSRNASKSLLSTFSSERQEYCLHKGENSYTRPSDEDSSADGDDASDLAG